MSNEDITVHVPKPDPAPGDKYCVACGADEKTDARLVGGFLPFIVISPGTGGNPARWAWLCSGCLTMVLRACRVGWAGQVAELSVNNPYLGESAG